MTPWANTAFPFKNIPIPLAITENGPSSAQQPLPQEDINMDSDDPYQGDGEEDTRLDPRISILRQPNRRRKTHHEKLLHTMIRHYLVHRGFLPKGEDEHEGSDTPSGTAPTHQESSVFPASPRSPELVVVNAYMDHQHAGPSRHDPLFLWSKPATHAWNREVVRILASSFIEYVKDHQVVRLAELLGDGHRDLEKLREKLDNIAPISKLINDKLNTRRSTLQTQSRKVGKMVEQSMTTAEITAAFENKKTQAKCRARRAERRKLRYERRYNIIQHMLHSAAVLESPEAQTLWTSIEQFYSSFQFADISSDETEREATHLISKKVRRIRRFWINPEASKVFHFIDSKYSPRTIAGSTKRGSAPLSRALRAEKVNKKALPRPQLPKNVYSEEVSLPVLKALQAKPPITIPRVPEVPTDIIEAEI